MKQIITARYKAQILIGVVVDFNNYSTYLDPPYITLLNRYELNDLFSRTSFDYWNDIMIPEIQPLNFDRKMKYKVISIINQRYVTTDL